ncbi:glycosyltransferase family 2 protein [Emticicia sp. TH156]|uniref:glycosyltransferase n=1 Tax=Emticicia sp. TH156 TaxID=2067454 RepID=UPI000C767D3C|nr:glycosyltransferase family A protein [Emticicia sp. TH156]PLK42482.1 family 2 glycosyl transferase [Emticicia sp. TH156]
MTNPISISVVIPTYKRPELLSRCLEALAMQTFSGGYFEVIIVCDGPDDPTANVIQAFINRFEKLQYYSLKQRSGPATARNYGWKQALGQLIVFTDDDCIPSPEWLNEYWRVYCLHPEPEIGMSGCTRVPIPVSPTDYEKNVSLLEKADFITANCACTKNALQVVGGFDEDFPIAWREDSALEYAFHSADIPIIKIQEAVVTHPVRKAHWGISLKEQSKSIYDVLLHKKYPAFFSNNQTNWVYYTIIISSIVSVTAFLANQPIIGLIAFAIWFSLFLSFVVRRLQKTNLSFSHIAEMLITSALIPYLSVYWTLRGAIRYKVFYL